MNRIYLLLRFSPCINTSKSFKITFDVWYSAISCSSSANTKPLVCWGVQMKNAPIDPWILRYLDRFTAGGLFTRHVLVIPYPEVQLLTYESDFEIISYCYKPNFSKIVTSLSRALKYNHETFGVFKIILFIYIKENFIFANI